MTASIEAISSLLSPRYAQFIRTAMTQPASCTLEDFDRCALPEFLRQYENPMQRWPVIVSKERHAQFGRIAAGLVSLLRRAPQMAFGDDGERARDYFRQAPHFPLEEILRAPNGLEYCIARGDFVLTADGPRLLEFNMGPGIGGWQINMFESLYRNDPHIGWIFRDADAPLSTTNPMGLLMAHAFATARRQTAGRIDPSEINIGVAVPPSLKDSAQELIFARRPSAQGSAANGGRVISFTETAAIESESGTVRIDGVPVHAVVALTYSHESWVIDRLSAAFKRGELALLNGPAPVLLGNKCAVALLSEMADTGKLESAERALVDASVPWTRRIVGDTRMTFNGEQGAFADLASKYKDRLVLKPDDDTNGNGVILGRHTDAAQWRSAVDAALRNGHYVAQEYCASQILHAPVGGKVQPHNFVWSAFVFGDAFAGSYVRMMPSADALGVINCYRGASEAIVFQHD